MTKNKGGSKSFNPEKIKFEDKLHQLLVGLKMQSDNFRRRTGKKTMIFYENDEFDHVGLIKSKMPARTLKGYINLQLMQLLKMSKVSKQKLFYFMKFWNFDFYNNCVFVEFRKLSQHFGFTKLS